jgi:superfamily II DNA or RNA helicase
VKATEEEERRFNAESRKIASCYKGNKCIDLDRLVKSLRTRLRIIAMAQSKQDDMDLIIDKIGETNHFVVYCGDGRTLDIGSGDEIRHIQFAKRALTGHGYKSSQFTATENMDKRMQLVDAFNKGEIDALAAIRCLDEGINIPSIKSALILASNDDYREFVQRRGRILRTYSGKEYANIYDVIVLPSFEMNGWAKIELRRFYEYAKLSKNWTETQEELDDLLVQYGLCLDDINVYDYEDEMEEMLDE